jgi:hypothetical protein
VTRAPRKPSRTRPLAAFKPVAFVVLAAIVALFLLQQSIAFVVSQSSEASEALESR